MELMICFQRKYKLFRQGGNMTRTQRVESKKELEHLLDDFITRGYKIKQQGQYSAKVKEKDWGDIPIHGFLFLFTLVAGAIIFDAAGMSTGAVWVAAVGANITYAAYSWYTAEEIIIKVEEDRIE